MQREFRVIDCRTDVIDPAEIVISAATPEEAARLALGEDLTRGSQAKSLRARVYFEAAGQTKTMVRLYAKLDDDGQSL